MLGRFDAAESVHDLDARAGKETRRDTFGNMGSVILLVEFVVIHRLFLSSEGAHDGRPKNSKSFYFNKLESVSATLSGSGQFAVYQ